MDLLKLATALDPWFKLDWCSDSDQLQIRDLTKQELPTLSTAQPVADTAEPPRANQSLLFNFMKKTTTASLATLEHLDYYSESVFGEETELLTFPQQAI